MWYIRVWIGPHSMPPGAMIGRFGVTGFVAGGGLREPRYSTLGWAVLLPGSTEYPWIDGIDGARWLSEAALNRLYQIAQSGRYYSATYIYAQQIGDVR